MKKKGISLQKSKLFLEEKKFIIKLWTEIFDKIGEAEVKDNFKNMFNQETFAKFPEILTKENIEKTILSLNEHELKSK